MKRVLTALMTVVAVSCLAVPAMADWFPGMDYKWVQMPQINWGWDVNGTWPNILADDFLCTRPGPIRDLHFWFSVEHDLWQDALAGVQSVHVSIHKDIPVGSQGNNYSMPENPPLWERDFAAEITVLPWPEQGPQGWFDPVTGEVRGWPNDPAGPDHFGVFQANIVDIPEPFIQRGTPNEPIVYWLDLSVKMVDGWQGPKIGWKTSMTHWNDDAVFGVVTPGAPVQWQELRDPITHESLDLAFVITPEPSTVVMLLGVGLVGLVAYLRRRK